MRIILEGQVRGGKNNITITRTGGRYPNKLFNTWAEDSTFQVWEQVGLAHEIRPYDEPLAMTLDYWPGDARIRDMPAILDAVFHVLEASGVVKNDKWVKRMKYIEHEINRDNPRVEMELWPLAEGF